MADNTEKDPDEWVSGHDPMTGAQVSYLKTLAGQAHEPDPTEGTYEGGGIRADREAAGESRTG
jgi:hypothetical protein